MAINDTADYMRSLVSGLVRVGFGRAMDVAMRQTHELMTGDMTREQAAAASAKCLQVVIGALIDEAARLESMAHNVDCNCSACRAERGLAQHAALTEEGLRHSIQSMLEFHDQLVDDARADVASAAAPASDVFAEIIAQKMTGNSGKMPPNGP